MNIEAIRNAKTMAELSELMCAAGLSLSDEVLWAGDSKDPMCYDYTSLGIRSGRPPLLRDLQVR